MNTDGTCAKEGLVPAGGLARDDYGNGVEVSLGMQEKKPLWGCSWFGAWWPHS